MADITRTVDIKITSSGDAAAQRLIASLSSATNHQASSVFCARCGVTSREF